ncbi:MAG: amidohydrolase [Alphaproteobacteria bacterium]|nr:amidohydrolase [Alphaproteobacteria bacterium]
MSSIDVDTHVIESEETWSFLEPAEARWRPVTYETDGNQVEWNGLTRFWYVDGQLLPRGRDGIPGGPSVAVRTLASPPERITWMKRLGVDVQVIIPTFFLSVDLSRPDLQVALARSYNRWLAKVCANSGGRLRWSVVVPFKDIAAGVEEIRWGAAHGALSVFMRPLEEKRVPSDPYFHPIYAEAEKHNLAIGIHIGNVDTRIHHQPKAGMYSVVPMAGAFVNLFLSDLPKLFPRLRFGFLEAGSEWLPYALRELSRGALTGGRTPISVKDQPLAGTNFYIACHIDEDISYVLKFAGPENLVLGSDFGHNDLGTDMDAHRLLLQRRDVPAPALAAIVDRNGRRLYGLV